MSSTPPRDACASQCHVIRIRSSRDAYLSSSAYVLLLIARCFVEQLLHISLLTVMMMVLLTAIRLITNKLYKMLLKRQINREVK